MPETADFPDLSPYAGRWVALVGNQVTGVGFTAVEAQTMARHSRPKERFTIRYVEEETGETLPLSPLLDKIRPLLAQETQPVYLVGGVVRDALLGRVSHDLDFVVPEAAVKLAFRVADELGVPAYVLDKERDTGRVMLSEAQTSLDFACFRGADLEADLQDRDFTMNAIALPATARRRSSLIDPCGGQADLENGLIRHIHDRSLLDDPVRVLRALRLSLSLDFSLAEATKTAVRQAAPHLTQTSAERIRDELLRLLQTAVPHKALQQLKQYQILSVVLPEIARLEGVSQSPPHYEPVLAHTISVLRWLERLEATLSDDTVEPAPTAVSKAMQPFKAALAEHWQRTVDGGVDGRTLLRLSALFHDAGKPATKTVTDEGRIRFLGHETMGAKLTGARLRALCLSKQSVSHVKRIVAGHMRPLSLVQAPGKLSRRAIYRYFRDTGEAGLDIGILALADHLATYDGMGPEPQWQRLVDIVTDLFHHYFERFAETVSPPPLLDGRFLMEALHLEPGPEVGRLLRLVQEAQAAGEIHTREEALHYARKCRS